MLQNMRQEVSATSWNIFADYILKYMSWNSGKLRLKTPYKKLTVTVIQKIESRILRYDMVVRRAPADN